MIYSWLLSCSGVRLSEMAEADFPPLADKFKIMELMARYSHAIDSGDPDGVADCFIPDGTFRGRSGYFPGRAELRKLGMTLRPDCIPRHITSNVLITGKVSEPDR